MKLTEARRAALERLPDDGEVSEKGFHAGVLLALQRRGWAEIVRMGVKPATPEGQHFNTWRRTPAGRQALEEQTNE